MGEKYNQILAAEVSFARRVALGVIVKRPVKPLLQIIPGMFIVDFLRRNNKIRRYSRFYIPPRRLALDAARDIVSGEKREEVVNELEEKVRVWLDTQGFSGDAVGRALMDVVQVLIEHNIKLLRADGETYQDLVQRVYESRSSYQSFLARLSHLERAYIRALSDRVGSQEDIRAQLTEEQDEAEAQREKEIDPIFL